VRIWSVLIITKQRHARILFSADPSLVERELACTARPNDVPWFAEPSADVLRNYMRQYPRLTHGLSARCMWKAQCSLLTD
jgi:hypothetical protein